MTATLSLASISLPGLAAEPDTTLVKTMDADAFLQTIGANTHMGAAATGPSGTSYGNPDAIIRQLRLTGIKHVRDTLFVGDRLPALVMLYRQLGVKADLVYDDYRPEGSTKSLRAALDNVRPASEMIEALEGPNEPDQFGLHFDGLTGAAAVFAAQKALYTAAKEEPAFARIPIFCPALSYPAAGGLASKLQDLSAFCDFSASHNYVENRSLGPSMPLEYLRRWSSFADAFVPGRPHVNTEGGWPTNPGDAEGVDEPTQAKYLLTYLLDAALLGLSRSYIYDLADDGPDPGFTGNVYHYGLFRYDGTPKPAATMLAAVNTLLAGGPGPGAGDDLAFRVSGLSATGHSLTLRRANGSQVIALWNDDFLWNRERHRPRPTAEQRIGVEFTTPVAQVRRVDLFSDAPPRVLPVNDNKISTVISGTAIFLDVDVRPLHD